MFEKSKNLKPKRCAEREFSSRARLQIYFARGRLENKNPFAVPVLLTAADPYVGEFTSGPEPISFRQTNHSDQRRLAISRSW
jgi:hypothetical protein